MAWEPCKTKNKKHNYSGGVCLNGCGIKQEDLKKKQYTPPAQRKQERGIYCYEQELAKKLWLHYKKKEPFGLFMGLIKRKGESWAKGILNDIAEGRDLTIKQLMYYSRVEK